MRIKYILLLLIFFCSAMHMNSLTTLKSDYTDIENSYTKLDNAILQSKLNALKPVTPDEKAFVAYYKAKINQKSETMISELIKVADVFLKSDYGQKACLDLGMIFFLERDLSRSLSYLSRITSPSLTEKDYWLAKLYLTQNENEKAILSGQSYLKTAANPEQIENTYYVIANAYIKQRSYENVQTLLTKLDKIPDLPKHKVYYCYLRGYAYDLAGYDEKALEFYKHIYALDRYSQFAFLTEERLFAMKSRMKNKLDISFIYPDSVYHPAPEIPDTAKTASISIPKEGEKSAVEAVPDSIQMVQKTGHGIFLQLGRFSTEQNAQKLMLQLKDDDFEAIYFASKQDKKITYRVLIGPFKTKAQSEKMKKKLAEKKYNAITITR